MTACPTRTAANEAAPYGMPPDLVLQRAPFVGNFPPPEFALVVEQARQGTLAPTLAALAVDPAASPLGAGYKHPELVSEEVWRRRPRSHLHTLWGR